MYKNTIILKSTQHHYDLLIYVNRRGIEHVFLGMQKYPTVVIPMDMFTKASNFFMFKGLK